MNTKKKTKKKKINIKKIKKYNRKKIYINRFSSSYTYTCIFLQSMSNCKTIVDYKC